MVSTEKLLDHWVRCFFPSYGNFIGNPSPFSYGGSPVVTMVVSMLSHGLSYQAVHPTYPTYEVVFLISKNIFQRITKTWFICHVSPI